MSILSSLILFFLRLLGFGGAGGADVSATSGFEPRTARFDFLALGNQPRVYAKVARAPMRPAFQFRRSDHRHGNPPNATRILAKAKRVLARPPYTVSANSRRAAQKNFRRYTGACSA